MVGLILFGLNTIILLVVLFLCIDFHKKSDDHTKDILRIHNIFEKVLLKNTPKKRGPKKVKAEGKTDGSDSN